MGPLPMRACRRAWLLSMTVLLLAALPAQAADTLRYVILVDNGKQAGHQTTRVGDDGVVSTEFMFNH